MNFEKLDSFIEKIKNDGCPFFGIKVAKNGKEVYEKIFGKRADGTNADYDDLFYMYSATKVITAVAAMQCVENGKFSLDDPVGNYIPEFKKQDEIPYALNFRIKCNCNPGSNITISDFMVVFI